jgi:hypothetical protein
MVRFPSLSVAVAAVAVPVSAVAVPERLSAVEPSFWAAVLKVSIAAIT